MADRIDLRDKQIEIANRTIERATEGSSELVLALLAPGFGKELGWMNAAVELHRRNLIDLTIDLTPRISLCEQAEINWYSQGENDEWVGWRLCYDEPVPGVIKWTNGNRTPFWRPPEAGYITTYASLANSEKAFDLHMKEARSHSGRLFLVCDEAAALGGLPARPGDFEQEEDEALATRAALAIKRLAEHAAVTLYLTGAPDRGDGRMLVNCEHRYRKVVDANGRSRAIIEPDVKATYQEGVGLGILRPPEVFYFNAKGRQVRPDETEFGISVQDSSTFIGDALRSEGVWQPMVELVIAHLQSVRESTGKAYQAGIACMDAAQATDIEKFARNKAPGIRVAIALSRDTEKSREALAGARNGDVDLLVFVRQAFIGFNCPQMIVLGILTHYRDESHLTQLCGRVFRQWKDGDPEQVARLVTLNDPRSRKFFERLKVDGRLGLAIRKEREGACGGGGNGTSTRDTRDWRSDGYVAEDTEGDVDDAERIFQLMKRYHVYGTVRDMKKAFDEMRRDSDQTQQGNEERPRSGNGRKGRTAEARIAALISATDRNIGRVGSALYTGGGFPDIGSAKNEANRRLGKRAGWAAGRGKRPDEQIVTRRYEMSCTMCRENGLDPVVV